MRPLWKQTMTGELPDKIEVTEEEIAALIILTRENRQALELPWGAQRVFVRQKWAIEAVLEMRKETANMTVFLVMTQQQADQHSEVVAAFSTREKAEAFMEVNHRRALMIDEVEVDR